MHETRQRPAIAAGHRHAEAYCLMIYQTEDGALSEILWNSRDGVTPFIIASADGRNMRHIAQAYDRYSPNHQPTPGQRIFVTLSAERATALARERVDAYWDHHEFPAREMFATKDEAITVFTRDLWHGGQAPTIVTVRDDGTW